MHFLQVNTFSLINEPTAILATFFAIHSRAIVQILISLIQLVIKFLIYIGHNWTSHNKRYSFKGIAYEITTAWSKRMT